MRTWKWYEILMLLIVLGFLTFIGYGLKVQCKNLADNVFINCHN